MLAELIETLVGDRIRLHNIQMLRRWEGNHRFDSTPFDHKIVELKAQNKSARALLAEARDWASMWRFLLPSRCGW
ncbi:MAG: hypothetical protein IPN76_04905 [Saprospiraceae bacterium]|nr:hypothetical protein [Saprospiraceae bacterium]